MRTYHGKVGFVDCSVLAIVERLAETKLGTLDHRHFATMRSRHIKALDVPSGRRGFLGYAACSVCSVVCRVSDFGGGSYEVPV
jgi:hypothetical protein